MLPVALATIYLMAAFAIVLTADRVAGVMFARREAPDPSIFRISPFRLFRRATKPRRMLEPSCDGQVGLLTTKGD